MLDLSPPSAERLPLQLASRLLSAPGVWVPGSALPLDGLGALVTPPLGWQWDGNPMPWRASAAGLLWCPPRRPLERFLRRLRRLHNPLPLLLTLAPDVPAEVERAARAVEGEEAAGLLLWDGTAPQLAAARRGQPALPLLAECPCTELAQAHALAEAGAEALWLGPPRAGRGQRLWGPAGLPLLLMALDQLRAQGVTLPLVAGFGIGAAAGARRLRAAGADALALDPAWWVQPGLAAELTALL